MPAKRIIFVSHDASRSGAPMVLLNFMRWLKDSGHGIEMALLLSGGGPMLEQFKQFGPAHILDRKKIAGGLPLPFKPDIFYYNSVAGALLGPTLPAGLCASICHVHELEFAIQTITWPTKTTSLLSRFDRIIACSDAVRHSLMVNRGVASERIDVVHEFVSHSAIESRINPAEHYPGLRRELQLPENALVVGCVANFEWRKGTDLFIQLALAVRRKSPDVPAYFVWVGGTPSSYEAFQVKHDLSRLPALRDRILLIPPQPDPLPHVAGFDLFVLPSREDPLPLVGLEAGACGKPVICFDSAGGMPEFVQSDAGVVVPYLDIEAMADSVIRLLRDPQARAAMGKVASQRVREHHDVSVAGPRLLESIDRAIAAAKSKSK